MVHVINFWNSICWIFDSNYILMAVAFVTAMESLAYIWMLCHFKNKTVAKKMKKG